MDNLHTEKDEKITCQYISCAWLSLVTKNYRVDSLNMLLHSAGNTADHYTIWRRISELYWVNQKLYGYPIILRKLYSERIFPCGKTVLAQSNETDLTIIHPDQGCSYRLADDGRYNLRRQFVLCPNNNPHVKRAVFRLPNKDLYFTSPKGDCENGSPCLFSYHYFSEP